MYTSFMRGCTGVCISCLFEFGALTCAPLPALRRRVDYRPAMFSRATCTAKSAASRSASRSS